MKSKWLVLALFSAFLFCVESFAGEWPMFRKSPHRVAFSSGVSTINRPSLLWRLYLGGSLSNDTQWAEDVNGDGITEFVYIAGGKLVAKLPDDSIVWDTKPFDLFRIERIGDIDGMGRIEIVASALAGKVYVFSGSDGSMLWEMPSAIFGNIGAVRWADFDGDGLDDMYVADQACGSSGSLGDIGIAFSFAGGAGSPAVLFQLQRGVRDYICGNNDSIGDFDGDGSLEVLALGMRRFYLFDTLTGSLKGVSDDLGSLPYGLAATDVRDIDGDGTDEILCYTNNSYTASINSRRVFLVGWNGTNLSKRWEVSVSDLERDQHNFAHNGLTDLDGDGNLEVVTSFYENSSGVNSTYVLDALTGFQIETLRNATLRGIMDIDGDGLDEVMTVDSSGSLNCYNFVRGSLALLWSLPSIRPVYFLNVLKRDRQSAINDPLVIDFDGDGIKEMVAYHLNTDGIIDEIQVLNAETNPPSLFSSYSPGVDKTPLTMQPFENITETGMQVVMARSDGYLIIFDRGFIPVNDPSDIQTGMRIGGYYSGRSGWGQVPVAGDLDGDGDIEIVVRDSKGSLLGLDARGASLVTTPLILWERRGETYPTIVDMEGDGRKEIITEISGYGSSKIRVVESNGTTVRWERMVSDREQIIQFDPVPEDVTGDGIKDILFNLFDRGNGNAVIGILNGIDGTDLWPGRYSTLVAGSGYGGSAFWDVTGDGKPDAFVCPRNLMVILDGGTGSQLRNADAGYCQTPAILNIDSDSDMEVVSVGSHYEPRAFDLNLNQIWRTSSGRNFTRDLGSFANCPTGKVFMEPPYNSPILMLWNAATGEFLRELVLAEGGIYSTINDAIADGKRPGILGNVTVKEDLTGTGRTGALIGSTDGYLYAIDPCNGSLIWSLNFRYPVGESIFADTDYDGIDEIVVTVADGYIYGVDREIFPAPGWVYDTDPPSGITDADVDSIETADTLYASWEAVPLATSYEYGVLTASGNFITVPEFINVGNVTSVTASPLNLRLGGRYYVAVRAIGPAGSSSEAISDGVTIVDGSPPTVSISATPNPFSPDGDGFEDTTSLSIRLRDKRGVTSWQLVIFDSTETNVVKDFGERASHGTDFLEMIEWDGKDASGMVVSEGEYIAIVVARDESLHQTRQRLSIFVEFPRVEESISEVMEEGVEQVSEEDFQEAGEIAEAVEEQWYPDAAVDARMDVEQDLMMDGELHETKSGCSCSIVK